MSKHSLVLDQTTDFVVAVLDKADKKRPCNDYSCCRVIEVI